MGESKEFCCERGTTKELSPILLLLPFTALIETIAFVYTADATWSGGNAELGNE